MIAQIKFCTYMLSLQNLNGLNTRPKNVFLWGSSGTGKTLLLVEILKMYSAHFKLKMVKTKVLVIVYYHRATIDSQLMLDLKTKYLVNNDGEFDVQIMTFKQACEGTYHLSICFKHR